MVRKRVLDSIAVIACRHYRAVLLLALLVTVLSIIPPTRIGMRFAFDIGKMLPQDIDAARHFTRAVTDFDSADEAVVVFHLGGSSADVARAGAVADRITERLRENELFKNVFCRKFDRSEADYLFDTLLPERGLLFLNREAIARAAENLQPENVKKLVRKTRNRLRTVSDEKMRRQMILDVLGLYSIFQSELAGQSGIKLDAPADGGYIVDDKRSMLLLVAQPREPAQSVEVSARVMKAIREAAAAELAQEPALCRVDPEPPGSLTKFWARLRGRDAGESADPETARIAWIARELEKNRESRRLPPLEGLDLEFGGGYEISCRYTERVNDALLNTFATSLIGVVLLFGYCFRRRGVLLYIGLPLAMVVCWTIGLGWIIFGQLNIVSCAFAAVLVGLGVDYAVHIYNRYVEERVAGKEVEDAFRASLTHTGWGVFIGMLTTALAFLALKGTRFTQLSEFGVLAGVGIALSVPGMMFIMPALISWRNSRRKEHLRVLQPTHFNLPQLAMAVEKHRLAVIALALAALAACAVELAFFPEHLRFNEHMSSLRPDERAFELTGEIARAFSKRNPNKLMLLSYGASEEEAMQRAAAQLDGCKRMKERGLLLGYESAMEYLPSPQEQRERLDLLKRIDFDKARDAFKAALAEQGLDESWFAVNLKLLEKHAELTRRPPEEAIMLASYFKDTPLGKLTKRFVTRRRHTFDIRYDKIPADMFPLTLAKPVKTYSGEREVCLYQENDKLTPADIEKLQGRVKRITVLGEGWTVKANLYPPVLERSNSADLAIDDAWLAQSREVLDLDKRDARGEPESFLTGAELLAHELATVVKADFWRVSTYVFLISTGVLIVFFHRHPARVLYCVMPIVMGLLLLFGLMSFLRISFNFINVLAIPIVIGLGVDNGIHLVARFYESGRNIRPVIADTGRAIMITTLTSIVGFGSLAIGGYQGLTSMGILSILALSSNLICSLIVLPAVIRTLSPPEKAPSDYAADQDSGWLL